MTELKKIAILFGTQTGNSEDIAERISRLILRLNCKCFTSSLNDYLITRLITETLVIFVCSTTGDGDFPDNMKTFWKFLLRKNLPCDSLSQLHFCVLGMGDSSYDKFNVVAKKLNKRLLQLGATQLLPLALADDQHELGYDAVLDPWLRNLQDKLIDFYQLSGPFISEDNLLPSKFRIEFLESVSNESIIDPDFKNSEKCCATLRCNERVTSADHFQAVHLLKFAIGSDLNYQPGDVAVVWPENPVDEVEEFLSLINVPQESKFILVPRDPTIPLPKISPYPCTVRECATSYFDFLSVPRRSFFDIFYHFSKDELEKEKLKEFTTPAGQEELYSYCNRPRRNILEVLKDFPQTTPFIPFEYFFDMIPCIRSRSFSIASSLSLHPNECHLLVAVVKYKTRLLKPRKGLCSNWLSKLPVGTTIPFSTKSGSISLPKGDKPIIMVGPGTGCAPFRSFIQSRVVSGISENYLFFGCRNKAKDFFFHDEWNSLVKKNLLTLFTAFSRDQDDKIYVQHKIAENEKLMWNLIDCRGACIYVAGNAKQMPQGVRDAFLSIFQSEGGLDEKSSLRYLQSLENRKQYQSETWA
ncbi:NADPH-dependent diflavin oxidoreductase 1-like [Uloborus diversus]|uniref:NADPH-dependent diflavin oxidoreductase 1-like n=1 Tax=Uloborus diversus TaxID=327109 RepID=UPI0024096EC3|nr:NADPH-dependent diflavin oxidoreductase 1-like [Uloborus diversus]